MRQIKELVKFTKLRFRVDTPETQKSPCKCQSCELCRDILAGADVIEKAVTAGHVNVPSFTIGVDIVLSKLREMDDPTLLDLIHTWEVIFRVVEEIEKLTEQRLQRGAFH